MTTATTTTTPPPSRQQQQHDHPHRRPLLNLDHVTSGLTKPPCCLGSAQLKENMTKPGFEPRTSWHIPRCSNH
ncbi:hypothetical protein SCLCIDRAFT_1219400 [Scleroderma citrinum Foug A]|uniref:Uncharacterized protein n=1 Tax=Scleroderma citrinum Foug A TaxID=1036808 RepID=A0A0C3DA05_9AGAM|nr:hypothetical protein SCLCIDRAFT_1219400 [Scleroderma citrinum Foug A]